MFWYISKEKLEALSLIREKRSFWPKVLAITLKEPFSASEIKLADKEVSKLAEQIQSLERTYPPGSVIDYEKLSGDVLPSLCRFSGVASRFVDENGFWVAMHDGKTALLLVGASSNAIGADGKERDGISPTADPVGAVYEAFQGKDIPSELHHGMSIERRLSYAWQSVWNAKGAALALPKVSGLAVLANVYGAFKSEMRRAHIPEISKLVVASPIFVRQSD